MSEWLRREKPVWTAWFIMLAIFILLFLVRLIQQRPSRLHPIVQFPFRAIWAGYLILVVRFFAGPRGISKPGEQVDHLTAWGYLWRSWILFFISLAVLTVGLVALNNAVMSLAVMIFGFLIAPPIAGWIFFGRRRKPRPAGRERSSGAAGA